MSSEDSAERRTNANDSHRHGPAERPERDDMEPFEEAYGRLRGHFKRRQDRYGAYQRWLSEARIGTTYDLYLTRSVTFGSLAAIIGGTIAALAVVLGALLAETMIAFRPSVGVPLVALIALFSGGSVVSGHLLYPRVRSRKRGRQIDAVLPHAIVFMHALSQSGQSPIRVIGELAALEDIYGEVAFEFDEIQKDIELYNNGLLTALESAQAQTPSDQLREFFDDLTSVIEAGGDVETFLDQSMTDQLERTKAELEELLEALVTLAEAYVTLVFFGPLLLLTVLIVFGITGRAVTDYLYLLTYVAIPLGIVGSIFAIHVLSRPYRLEVGETTQPEKEEPTPPESPESWFVEYTKRIRRQRLVRRFRNPIRTLRRNPLYTLGITAPVALGAIAFGVGTGILDPSGEAYLTAPIRYTTGFVVIPLFVVTTPLMGFHEIKRRRQRSVEERLPDVLYTLASSNRRGMDFVEGVELVARRYDDPIASEFRTVSRDIDLDNDTVRALTVFANRLQMPRLTMTVSVLQELVAATDDLSDPLRSLAADLETRISLQQTRNREMATYSVVVVLGILVYLLLIIVLDSIFIPQMTELPVQETQLFAETPPVVLYRTVFFHSALIQAFGNGLLIGTLTDDSLCSGLKYSNTLVAVVVLVFFLSP